MSLLMHDVHEQQFHPPYFVYSFQDGPAFCLACFLDSLADPCHLTTRKLFALRQFAGLFGMPSCGEQRHTLSAACGPSGRLAELLSQHATLLVSRLLAAFTATQDLGLAAALRAVCCDMCCAAPDFLPELFAERLLQLLLELPLPSDTSGAAAALASSSKPRAVQTAATLAAALQLLQDIVGAHAAARQLVASVLQASAEVAAVLTGALASGIEAAVVPLLYTFSVLAGSASGGCGLPSSVTCDLFLQLLELLPQLLDQQLRLLVLQLLLQLCQSGYALEQALQPPPAAAQLGAHSQPGLSSHNIVVSQYRQQQLTQQQQQQPEQAHHQPLARVAMAALKQVLLDTDASLQLLGCQLLAAIAARAPPQLLQQLIDFDACELLFEVLRATLGSCSMAARLAGASASDSSLQEEQESLQVAAVSVLRCLARQAEAFLGRLHFGLATLTELLTHCTSTANSPLLAETLLLLSDVTGPSQPPSLLLPLTAVSRLAVAAAAVLPEPDAGSGGGGGASHELQPSPELQAAYEAACNIITQVCHKWASGSSSGWAALQPAALSAAHRALSALSILSSRSLLSGMLPAVCQLLQTTMQLLLDSLAAPAAAATAAAAGAKPSAPQLENKPFAKRRRQQQQQQLMTTAAGAHADASGAAGSMAAADEQLCLMEGLLKAVLPAVSRASTWAAAAAGETDASCELAAAVGACFQQAVQLLLALLAQGSCCQAVSAFLPSFCDQLLGSATCWTSFTLGSLALLPEQQPHGTAATQAWQVLLLAAAQLEGNSFLTPGCLNNTALLAASLASRVDSNLALLELLCCPATAAAAAAGGSGAAGSARTAASRTAAANSHAAASTRDIRQFAGVSDLHRAALCILAAALRRGDTAWSLADVTTALNAAVAAAGPGMASQPELLLQIVLLYCQAEAQLAADLAGQAVQDGVLLTDQQGQQQYGAAAATVQLPQPAAITQAVDRLGSYLPELAPGSAAAEWILGKADQMPAAARLLLSRWGEALLAAEAPEHGCGALTDALAAHPSAQALALQLCRHSLDGQQLGQTAAWLLLLTAVLHRHSSSAGGDPPPAADAAASGTAGGGGSSRQLLQQLLPGPAGLLELMRCCLVRHGSDTTSGSSSSVSCLLMLACSSCLTVVLLAAGAAAAAGGGGLDQELLELLHRHALQQVHMTAMRLLQLPANHPQHGQLIAAAAAVGNTLIHSALVLPLPLLDAGLLQQLASCREINLLMAGAAAAAMHGPPAAAVAAAVAAAQQTGGCAEAQALHRLVSVVLGRCSLSSSNTAAAAAGHCQVSNEQLHETLMASCLVWHQHQQLLAMMGLIGPATRINLHQQQQQALPLLPVEQAFSEHCQQQQQQQQQQQAGVAFAGAPAGAHSVYGLTATQLLLLSQGPGAGSVLSLLLLDSARLSMLMVMQQQQGQQDQQQQGQQDQQQQGQQDQQQQGQQDQQQQGQQDQQQWGQLVFLLQNMAHGSSSSSLHQEAALGCLATLCCAVSAAANCTSVAGQVAEPGENSSSDWVAVASSPWHGALLQQALERLCQQAVALRGLAQAAEQTAVLQAQQQGQRSSSGTDDGAAGCAAWAASSWLLDPECQQLCDAWVADAQLLLQLLLLAVSGADAAAAATPGRSNAGGRGRGASSSMRAAAEQLTDRLRELLVPALEQQQLLPFLCWAAARGGGGDAGGSGSSFVRQPPQQHAALRSFVGVADEAAAEGSVGRLAAPAAAAASLQLWLSGTCLQLVAALLQAGCLQGQLPWLQQQLQQQLAGAPFCPPGVSAAVAAAGGVCVLSRVELVQGAAVALMRPAVMQQLMLVNRRRETGRWASPGDSSRGPEALLLPTLVGDCRQLLSCVAAAASAGGN